MGRTSDKTAGATSPVDIKDKKTDYRMFGERGKSDHPRIQPEGLKMTTELDGDDLSGVRTDQNKLDWATDVQRGLIDNKWW
jgi:hypothetical protein